MSAEQKDYILKGLNRVILVESYDDPKEAIQSLAALAGALVERLERSEEDLHDLRHKVEDLEGHGHE